MMNVPRLGCMPFGISPSTASQSFDMDRDTAITNIVINNEIGNDKSTNVKIRKNGNPLVVLIPNMKLMDLRYSRSSEHRFRLKL